jgi:hypothetical protein
MKKTFPQSTNVESAAYDPDTLELVVAFKKSGVYLYSGVPINVCEEFYAAASAGQFLNLHIKPKYSAQRIK